jgi:hypothetical protein
MRKIFLVAVTAVFLLLGLPDRPAADKLDQINKVIKMYSPKRLEDMGKDYEPLAGVMNALKTYVFKDDFRDLKKYFSYDLEKIDLEWSDEEVAAGRFALPREKADRILLWKRLEPEEVKYPGTDRWMHDFVSEIKKLYKEKSEKIELKKNDKSYINGEFGEYRYYFPRNQATVLLLVRKKKPFDVFLQGIYLQSKSPYCDIKANERFDDPSDKNLRTAGKVFNGLLELTRDGNGNALAPLLSRKGDEFVRVSWELNPAQERKYTGAEMIDCLKSNDDVIAEIKRMIKEYRKLGPDRNKCLEAKTEKKQELLTVKLPSGAGMTLIRGSGGFLGLSEQVRVISFVFPGFSPYF